MPTFLAATSRNAHPPRRPPGAVPTLCSPPPFPCQPLPRTRRGATSLLTLWHAPNPPLPSLSQPPIDRPSTPPTTPIPHTTHTPANKAHSCPRRPSTPSTHTHAHRRLKPFPLPVLPPPSYPPTSPSPAHAQADAQADALMTSAEHHHRTPIQQQQPRIFSFFFLFSSSACQQTSPTVR